VVEEYDVVLLYRKLAYADYGRGFVAKAARVLRPGGVVVVAEPTTDGVIPSASFLPEMQLMDWLVGGDAAPPIRSTDQIAALLVEGGFGRTEVVVTSHGIRFVLGWRDDSPGDPVYTDPAGGGA